MRNNCRKNLRMSSSKSKIELDDLRKHLEASDVTPELRKQATQLVFGSGNQDADIVFIGEAPGQKEDLTGEPFVGAAGKFLDELLASIELDRSEVYITNIVKYRPPNNRDPLPEEKAAFLPFLYAQLLLIRPQIVVTLGRHSGSCFLPDLRISQDHAQPRTLTIPYEEAFTEVAIQDPLVTTLLPLYHPAAALYNGAMRHTLIEDFQILKTLIIDT